MSFLVILAPSADTSDDASRRLFNGDELRYTQDSSRTLIPAQQILCGSKAAARMHGGEIMACSSFRTLRSAIAYNSWLRESKSRMDAVDLAKEKRSQSEAASALTALMADLLQTDGEFCLSDKHSKWITSCLKEMHLVRGIRCEKNGQASMARFLQQGLKSESSRWSSREADENSVTNNWENVNYAPGIRKDMEDEERRLGEFASSLEAKKEGSIPKSLTEWITDLEHHFFHLIHNFTVAEKFVHSSELIIGSGPTAGPGDSGVDDETGAGK